MQKESDINKDSLSAQWLLVKTGAQNTFSSLGETLRQPLMDILYTVKSVTGALRRWVEANPELTGTLMKHRLLWLRLPSARHLSGGAGCSAGAAGSDPSGILCAGYQNVIFRYGSSNSNQQRVVLAGWRTTGTAVRARGLLHRATPQVYLLRRCRLCAARHH